MKTKIMQLSVIGALGSLFFVGCASDRAYNRDLTTRPIDLLDEHADTYRASRTGLEDFVQHRALNDMPSARTGIVIEEAAGAERPSTLRE